MKNKKRFIYMIMVVFVIAIAGLCTACTTGQGNGENANGDAADDTENDVAAQKQKAEETIGYINQLEVTNTVEEINAIIGVEGTKSEYSEEYKWEIDDKNYIMLKFAGDSPILQATVNKEAVKNEDLSLPSASELQQMLNDGSFTYQELVEKMDGVEGYLSGKTSGSVSYSWVDKHNMKLSATFNNESGKCTIANIS